MDIEMARQDQSKNANHGKTSFRFQERIPNIFDPEEASPVYPEDFGAGNQLVADRPF